jgi:hypothetical protein
VTATTAFTESENVNSAYYIGMFFPIILKCWIMDFTNFVPRLTKGFENRIITTEVTKVTKQNDSYLVHTSDGDYIADNIVFAAPQKSLKGVYEKIPTPHIQQGAYTLNVKGRRRGLFNNKKAICFRPEHNEIFMIWQQKCGLDLIYSKCPNPDLSIYYEKFHINKTVHWDPGMVIPDGTLIDQHLEKNAYLASNYLSEERLK